MSAADLLVVEALWCKFSGESHVSPHTVIILHRINVVLLCPPFNCFGVFQIDPESPALKNLPSQTFSIGKSADCIGINDCFYARSTVEAQHIRR